MATNVRNRPELNTPTRFHNFGPSTQTKANHTPPHAGVRGADAFDDVDTGVERNVMEGFKRQFGEIAKSQESFHKVMQQIFHRGYDRQAAEDYRRRAVAGDYSWLPPVKLVDSATLQGANGAYDAEAGVVYLRRDLDPALAVATYVEETGHHLDTKLNKTDTPGDEGEMFRRILGGEKLSQAEKQEIRTENDHGVINVEGQAVNVEFFSFKKAFKKIGSGFKKVFNGVKKGIKKVGGFISNGIKKVGGVLKKVGNGVLKVLNKLSPFAPLLNLIPGIGTVLYAAFNGVKALAGLAAGKFKSAFGSILSGVTGGLGGAFGGVLGKVVNFGSKLFKGGGLGGMFGNILNMGGKLFKGGAFGKILNFGTKLLGKNPLGAILGGANKLFGGSRFGRILGRITDFGRTPIGSIVQRAAESLLRKPLGRIRRRIANTLRRTPVGRFLQRVADRVERIRSRVTGFLPRVPQFLSGQSLLGRLAGYLRT